MRPLTPDDLLPLEEFAGQRRQHFESHLRYLERYRRVRLGPRVMMVFENRQTLWFRVQELLRVARLADPRRVREELSVCNRLLPGRGRLQAALLIEPSEAETAGSPWQDLRGDEIRLHLGSLAVPAQLITCRPEDAAIGAAHWLAFDLDATARRRLADLRHPARFEIGHASYRHDSGSLSDEVRQSLVDDLDLSDKD